MTFLAELTERLRMVTRHAELDVAPGELLPAVRRLDDDAVVALLEEAAAISSCVERLKVVGAAVVAERSTGGGLARRRGFRNPVQLVQDITGGTRGDASRTLRVGSALLDDGPVDAGDGPAGRGPSIEGAAGDGEAGGDGVDGASGDVVEGGDGVGAGGGSGSAPVFIWHAELRDAMLTGALSTAQHDAIRNGLGEPADTERADEVWAIAAQQLMAEAADVTVEELRKSARAVRDALDPVGAEERFAERFAARSWREWTDEHGRHHAHIIYDDEMGAWASSVISAALRPRRGGPRFLTDAERAQAEALQDDDRTNDQLTYDLMMGVLRAGALATAEDVFGVRQPGVRLVTVKDHIGRRDMFGRLVAIANLEDGGDALPGSVLDAALCNTGTLEITVSSCGKPLDVGREKRLFTSAQKQALAIRDGGCMWPGCHMPASYCESHHTTPWAEGGSTDVDDGILLCRFHHLLLHNEGWRVTRDAAHGVFVLHAPTGERTTLHSKSPLRWAWSDPPDRPGWRTPPSARASAPAAPPAPPGNRPVSEPPRERPPEGARPREDTYAREGARSREDAYPREGAQSREDLQPALLPA
ncbi:HNH endonuclease signature motif containing protein [Microbacterium sp. MC2]